jgi:hypothetical protein
MHPPSTQQVHSDGSRHSSAHQTPKENGLQGSGSATPSTDSSFTPSSEFNTVYGGFSEGFYGATSNASSVSDQAGSSCSIGAVGSVNGGDPDEEVLILQEVTEEEVSI